MWAVRSAVAFTRGTLDPLYAGFVLSHIAIFLVAYVAIEDANTGWLAINVWHNFQYVLVVWMMNAKKYAGGIDPAARFLSRISQPGRLATYFVSCIAISTRHLSEPRQRCDRDGRRLAITVGIYMGINFHHYIVDALIWKRRRAIAHRYAGPTPGPQSTVHSPRSANPESRSVRHNH